jgi:hypothetical protein
MPLSLVVSLVLCGAPAPTPPLPTIAAPLGHFGAVVEPEPRDGVRDQEHPVRPSVPQCAPQIVYLMRYLGGVTRVVEQAQQWLDKTPGLERRLFARRGVLGDVLRHLAGSQREDKKACTPVPLGSGYQLELARAPRRLCAAGARGDGLGESWFVTAGAPAAVVSVQRGGVDPCLPRLSAVLFDPKGVARVVVHADWGGAVSATLLGDRCQRVDFALDPARQAFAPEMKSCKR